MNKEFKEYLSLLCDVHYLISLDKGDSEDANIFRARMEILWIKLNGIEKSLTREISVTIFNYFDKDNIVLNYC